jgi:hypothetical protein
MAFFNNKLFTIGAFAVTIYLISSSIHFKNNHYSSINHTSVPSIEERINDIRNKASGQGNSMIEEKEISLQEKIVYGIIDYIAGEDFRKTFIKHV